MAYGRDRTAGPGWPILCSGTDSDPEPKPGCIVYSFRETDGSRPGPEAFDPNLRQSFHGVRAEVPVANYNRPGATGPDRSGTDELSLLFASVFIQM
jgi:hypothetical protein